MTNKKKRRFGVNVNPFFGALFVFYLLIAILSLLPAVVETVRESTVLMAILLILVLIVGPASSLYMLITGKTWIVFEEPFFDSEG